MDASVLENIGLTHNESIVYLTLVKLGTSKAGEILKASNLNSGKIYEILESLKNKGLTSESVINKVRHFTAAPSSQILEYLKKKKEEIDKEEQEIKDMLPQLEKNRSTALPTSKAITYTGFRGIKTASDEALDSMKPREEILAMGVRERKDKSFNEFWQGWSQKRITKKIVAKHIFSEKGDYLKTFKNMKYTEVKVLEGLTPVTIDIFGEDKVLILNYNEPFSCTMIYDKNTAMAFRTFFYQLWKTAKR
jgi:HTH-type transcriptional regulator, sugar sensing transcriptional regulator